MDSDSVGRGALEASLSNPAPNGTEAAGAQAALSEALLDERRDVQWWAHAVGKAGGRRRAKLS